MAGYEIICKSVECAHNEDGFSCSVMSPAKPITIEKGSCTGFEARGVGVEA